MIVNTELSAVFSYVEKVSRILFPKAYARAIGAVLALGQGRA
jgi:hypothetical protein